MHVELTTDTLHHSLSFCHFFTSFHWAPQTEFPLTLIFNSTQRRHVSCGNRKPRPLYPLAALFLDHVATLDQSPFPLREQTTPFSILMWRFARDVGRIWVAPLLVARPEP